MCISLSNGSVSRIAAIDKRNPCLLITMFLSIPVNSDSFIHLFIILSVYFYVYNNFSPEN